VLIGTGRRARLLGGFLRLAAVSPQVDQGLHITGLRQHLGVFPTVQAAAVSPQGPAGERTQRRRCTRSTHRWRVEDGPETGRVTVSLTRRRASLPVVFSAIGLFWPSPGMMTHATR
jgi:hypothetical protein